jgi:hypothetical protein
VINCAALPETLLESELFGHEKGAFTGAIGTKQGLFEMADGGTLMIDEIGDMPGPLQAKLLRVLEDGSMRRIGSLKECRVDVRLLVATNRNMAEEVKAGRFREDLFYRIAVVMFEVPALRHRKVSVLEERAVSPLGRATIGWGEVSLVEKVLGYKKVKFYTHENAGYGDVRLPDLELHTTSCWLTLPEALVADLAAYTRHGPSVETMGRAVADGPPGATLARTIVVDALRGLGRALEAVADSFTPDDRVLVVEMGCHWVDVGYWPAIEAVVHADGDGNEQREHTSPARRDSDRDGKPDGREDADHDGLNNAGEDQTGNDPVDPDTDDDGTEDGDENAGTILSFENNALTIKLAGGGTVTGTVTDETEIGCETEDEHELENEADEAEATPEDHEDGEEGDGADEGDGEDGDGADEGDNSGPGNELDEDEVGDEDDVCTTADLVPGTVVHEAELELTADGLVFVEVDLVE